MQSEQQYIELYEQARELICSHAPEAMNAVRDEAFEDFRRQGFPSKKVERYKYTDMQKLFAPDYGVNLNPIPMRRSAAMCPTSQRVSISSLTILSLKTTSPKAICQKE